MAKAQAEAKKYWQAQGLIQKTLSHFHSAVEADNKKAQRRHFFRLANYHARTLNIVHTATRSANEPLATTALHNLIALHRALAHMHQSDPDEIPLPTVLHAVERNQLLRDLLVRVLRESSRPLSLEELADRVYQQDMLGQVSPSQVAAYVEELVNEGFVRVEGGRYARSTRPYPELDWNRHSLRALAGDELHARFSELGYEELTDLDNRPTQFVQHYVNLTAFSSPEAGRLLVEAARIVLGTSRSVSMWRSADIINSPYPRPYQRAAFSAIQHAERRGKIVDAPTGSGKTFIGMMCIQDWLRALDSGQSILIVVPTSNYLQQWTGELCYNAIGLGISPDVIFAGPPLRLLDHVLKTGEQPAIVLTTYAALAQTGSAKGKGGFDTASIEMLLQGAKIKFVILDEVHKVVENMRSITTNVVGVMMDWVQDGLIHDLVGLSGTVQAYRRQFDALSTDVVYSIPTDELVAAGFVAPYAEFGVPFSYSSRERTVRERLDDYKAAMLEYFDLMGAERLRGAFGQIPIEERQRIGHDILGMYRARRDWKAAIEKRFKGWEHGSVDGVSISEAQLVLIIQIAQGWNDVELAAQMGVDASKLQLLIDKLNAIRADLLELMYLPEVRTWLQAESFTTRIPVAELNEIETFPVSQRSRRVKSLLSPTVVGLYSGLSIWYMRMGEGRVEAIKAIVEAEMNTRPIASTIVFDRGRRIHWRDDVAAPGYDGVGGLFAQMLGDERFKVAAVLSGEIYLSHDADDPMTLTIADYIENTLIHGRASEAIFGLVTQGVDIDGATVSAIHEAFDTLITDYVPTLRDIGAARKGEFNKRILKPLRRFIKGLKLPRNSERLLFDRLSPKNINLRSLEETFFDYALIARAFREAHVAELEQISGQRQKFFVIRMSSNSHRKQLMYDLTARLVDAEEIPINFVIVSNWARTGWNVIKPNLLIDATATRDVTAWQQLIGRAIRASRSWTNDCYRLLTILTGHHAIVDLADPASDMSLIPEHRALDPVVHDLLMEVAPESMQERIEASGIDHLDAAELDELAVRLVDKRNKVTHIYELVKAYGSTTQVEYDREHGRWQRKEAIRNKHAAEDPPNPLTGERAEGDEHAPLIYAEDPRSDVPEKLREELERRLEGADTTIIEGWLA